MEQDYLCNFGRGHYEEHLRDFFFKFDRWLLWRCHLKIFQFFIWWPFCLMEQIHLCYFGRGIFGIILGQLVHFDTWFRRRCHLKVFLKKFIFSSGCHFV